MRVVWRLLTRAFILQTCSTSLGDAASVLLWLRSDHRRSATAAAFVHVRASKLCCPPQSPCQSRERQRQSAMSDESDVQLSAFSNRVSDFSVESHPSIQDLKLSKRSCHLVDAFGPLACLASKDVLRLRLVQALQRLHAVEALPHPLQRVGAASAGLLLVEVPRAGEHCVELTVHLRSRTAAQQPVRELSLREASH